MRNVFKRVPYELTCSGDGTDLANGQSRVRSPRNLCGCMPCRSHISKVQGRNPLPAASAPWDRTPRLTMLRIQGSQLIWANGHNMPLWGVWSLPFFDVLWTSLVLYVLLTVLARIMGKELL
jgi:hypothetical protein